MKKRKAFAMSVHAGMEVEYQRRHSPIWTELDSALKEHGVLNYSIFLHPDTGQLFAYVEIENEARCRRSPKPASAGVGSGFESQPAHAI
jgi:L-rhamnose mutarotase